MGNLELGSTTLAQSRSLPARVVLPPTCLTRIFNNPSGGQMEAWVRPCCRKIPLISKYHLGYLDPPSSSCKQSFERYSSSSEALMTSKSQAASNMLIVGNEKVGVLLLNHGGPKTLEDVQPFLFLIFFLTRTLFGFLGCFGFCRSLWHNSYPLLEHPRAKKVMHP